MGRRPDAALALIAMVGLPVIVGQVAKPDGGEPEPGPTESAVTVRLEESEKAGSDRARLHLLSDGPAPGAAAVLTAEDGRDPVRVAAARIDSCGSGPVRRATSAPDATDWCLELSGIEDGRKVSGKVKAAGTTLALTVSRREPIWPLPFLAALGGLVLGTLTILVPAWLRARVRTGLVDQMVERNEASAVELAIGGLREWVTQRREAGVNDDELAGVIAGIAERGPPAARRARAALAEALDGAKLPAGHAFVVAARDQAETRGHAITDFVDPDGTPRVVHPAHDWLTALRRLEPCEEELAAAESRIESALKEECRAEPREALGTARGAYAAAAEPDHVEGVDASLQALRAAMAAALARDECRAEEEEEFLSLGPVVVREPRPERREVLDLGTAGAHAHPPLGRLRVLTWVLIGIVVGWALVSLEQGVYEPEQAFGTTGDYLALVTAALGSGAAGAVLGLVAIWDPFAPAASD